MCFLQTKGCQINFFEFLFNAKLILVGHFVLSPKKEEKAL